MPATSDAVPLLGTSSVMLMMIITEVPPLVTLYLNRKISLMEQNSLLLLLTF